MQRPDWLPTIVTFCWPGGGLDGGGPVGGGVDPNWVKNRHTSGLTQLRAPLSQPAHPSTGPCWWPPSNAAHTTGNPARHEYVVMTWVRLPGAGSRGLCAAQPLFPTNLSRSD